MKNLYNYLEKNKDITLKEKPWNIMDNLFCACISYIPLTENFKMKSFEEVCEEVINYDYPSKPEYVSYTDKKMFTILKGSKRYHDMFLFNFVNIIDNNTQFGAITCKIGNKKVISFKGSDGSMIGWIENLRLLYDFPTYTQMLAAEYLKDNIHPFDYDVYVVGHSKGGNLAIASAMELNFYKSFRIKKIINFDGPGLKYNDFVSNKYQKIAKKVESYLPNKSYVGTLMYNDNIKIIDTSALMVGVHYPTNWLIENDNFVYSTQSKLSKELHIRTTEMLKDIDMQAIKNILEEVFKIFEERKKDHVGITLNDIHKIIQSINNAPKKEKDYLLSVIRYMFKLSNNIE